MITELIGKTKMTTIKKNIFAKIESGNPGFSIKDRIAKAMIEDAESKGIRKKGSLIIEPTSGNTGIGLALIAAERKYRLILVMPESMSIERRKILEFLGSEIILTSAAEGMSGAISAAEEIGEKQGGWMPRQFENPANPAAHFATTGPEIWEEQRGNVDIFVAGVGTGGTITGVGKFLKSKNPEIKVVAVEPSESAVLSGEKAGPHKIQGIGAGFIPRILEMEMVDEIIKISSEEATMASQKLAREHGILVGISSGAAFAAAKKIAVQNPKKAIVTIFPDSAERYLSTPLFSK